MASLGASTRFNFLKFAFPSPATQTSYTFVNNPPLEDDVITLEYDGGASTLTMVGGGINARDTGPTAGNVDELFFNYAGDEFAAWSISGLIASSASTLWRVTQTAATDDDASLLASCLAWNDGIHMSRYNDKANGFGGNDWMHGGSGHDTLYGGSGYDTLIGSMGADHLIGDSATSGLQQDTFTYFSARESGITAKTRDVIEDFTPGVDVLDLRAIDANSAGRFDEDFTGFIRATREFTRPGQLKLVDGVLYANVDTDAAPEFSVELTGVTRLSMDDILG